MNYVSSFRSHFDAWVKASVDPSNFKDWIEETTSITEALEKRANNPQQRDKLLNFLIDSLRAETSQPLKERVQATWQNDESTPQRKALTKLFDVVKNKCGLPETSIIIKNLKQNLPSNTAPSRPNNNILPPIFTILSHENLLINEGTSLGAQDAWGKTALHYAIQDNQEETFISLLEGKDLALVIDASDFEGNTPLLLALRTGRYKFAAALLNAGASVDVQNSRGNTLLHELVILGNVEACQFILNYSHPNLGLKDPLGYTPLALAWCYNNPAIASLITPIANAQGLQLDQGVLQIIVAYASLETMESFFAVNNSKDIRQIILECAYTANRLDIFELALKGADPSAIANSDIGYHVFAVACFRDKLDYVYALLNAGIQLDKLDKKSRLPLISALKFNRVNFEPWLTPERKEQIAKILPVLKFYMRIKSISHSAKIKAKFKVPGSAFGEELGFSGDEGHEKYWAKEMRKATGYFPKHFREIIPESTVLLLINTLRNFQTNDPATDLLRFELGLPVVKATGWASHSVVIMFWNHFYVIVNRGAESTISVEIKEFQRDRLTVGILEEITKVTHLKSAEYLNLIGSLPGMLNFKVTPVTDSLEKNSQLPKQIVENCSWESLEGAVWTILLLSATQGINSSGHLESPNRVVHPEDVAEIKYAFNLWLAFNQLYHLERHLNTGVIRTPSVVPKRTIALPPVPSIFDEAFAKISPFADPKSSLFHPHMKTLYDKIHTRYEKLKKETPPNMFKEKK